MIKKRVIRLKICQLIVGLTMGTTALIWSAESDPNQPINQALTILAKECFSPLKSKGETKVAMTYIFHNGSTETAVSNYTKRLLTTHLLREGGKDIALIDRQDFQLQHKEDGFAFSFSTGAGNLSQPVVVDAILVGELITSPSARTMVLCMKVIDPNTSKILSAPVIDFAVTKDFAEKLGISELDLNGLPTLPQPSGDTKTWVSELSAAFNPNQVTCSLDDPENTGAAMALNSRLLRAYLTSALVSSRWSLLEREMFFLVAKDQAAAGVESSSYPVGEVILRLEVNDTGGQGTPSCFAKAIRMKDGRLLGQSQITLTGPVVSSSSGSDIGGDQALAEALRRTQSKLAPAKEDSLVFTSSVILTNAFKPSNELRHFSIKECPNIFNLRDNDIISSAMNMMINPKKDDWEKGFDAAKHQELTLVRLNNVEKEDMNAIKTGILCALLWGYGYQFDDEQLGSSGFIHLGPLLDVVRQISGKYSLTRDGRDSTREWISYFIPTGELGSAVDNGFSGRLFQSLHPKFRATFDDPYARSKMVIPLTIPTGTYRSFPPQFQGQPSIHFEYQIEAAWKDAFPSTIKVTIDLTPMKNSIYKIKK